MNYRKKNQKVEQEQNVENQEQSEQEVQENQENVEEQNVENQEQSEEVQETVKVYDQELTMAYLTDLLDLDPEDIRSASEKVLGKMIRSKIAEKKATATKSESRIKTLKKIFISGYPENKGKKTIRKVVEDPAISNEETSENNMASATRKIISFLYKEGYLKEGCFDEVLEELNNNE